MRKLLLLILISVCLSYGAQAQSVPPDPAVYFGFTPGSDRNLFTYEELIAYLIKLDAASDRIEMRQIGESPEGKPMYIAFISMPSNIAKLDSLRLINRELALNPGLPAAELKDLTSRGKVFILATLSMHSSEVGPSQSAPLIAWDYATTTDPEKIRWLSDVVYMIVPCHNPDGMDMVVNYYNKTRGTPYEGSGLPGVYHKYVGHDNNRDFVMLSQKDTRAISRITDLDWFPQVMVEKHQMGMTGTRYFVPPNHDPIAENVDEGIWTRMGIFGANLMNDMTGAGLAGVSQNFLFDNYWPGSTETCIWKNVVGFLTECAGAKVATPVWVEPSEINVSGKGLAEYKKSVNMPLVWNGGWWKLSDIVNYEIVSTNSILKSACINKTDILNYRNELCRKEVMLGQTTAPYYYILPAQQHDQGELSDFISLMQLHGIRIYKLTADLNDRNLKFSAGDIVIPLAQPFRAFILEVMQKQVYPERHYVKGGEVIKPYDITSWSIPLHAGLKSFEIDDLPDGIDNKLMETISDSVLAPGKNTGKYMIFTVDNNESYKAAFAAVAAGLETGRTTSARAIGGKTFPEGSFVIQTPGTEKQESFLKEFTQQPSFMDEKPSTVPFTVPSVGLVETQMSDIDAGWTRFIFDSFHIPFKILHPGDLQKTDLSAFDVIVFPDNPKSVLMDGKYKDEDAEYIPPFAPEYTRGMGKEGLSKIAGFINDGGTVVSWGESANLFTGILSIKKSNGETGEFHFPVKIISEELKKEGLFCPGTLIRMKLTQDSPLTAGMPKETGIFFNDGPVFTTQIPVFDTDRRVIGIVPEDNIVMSGYCEKAEKLGNHPLMIWMAKGKGQIVLMAFRPQFRASTHATYKLLFNSILLSSNKK